MGRPWPPGTNPATASEYAAGFHLRSQRIQQVFAVSVQLYVCFPLPLGEHIRFKKEGTEQSRKVDKVLIHPQYNHTTTDSDLALLRLCRNITLGPYALPICLPPAKGTFYRTLGTVHMSIVSGWGRLAQSGPSSTVLQRLEVPRVSLEKCRAHSGLSLTNNMLCAGFKEGRSDACQGDSGGPLVTLYNKTWFLSGIVSWGKGCARSNAYGIYTRVSVFAEWIVNTMLKNEQSSFEKYCIPV